MGRLTSFLWPFFIKGGFILGLMALLSLQATAQAAPPTRPLIPVQTVMEMFTSLSCPSCPAADELLRSYTEKEGILGLSYHVNIFTKKPSTDPRVTEATNTRQKAYLQQINSRRIYTPHLVVNGVSHANGSNPFVVKFSVWEGGTLPAFKAELTQQDGQSFLKLFAASFEAPFLQVQEITFHPSLSENPRTQRSFSVENIRVLGLWQGKESLFTAPAPARPENKRAFLLQDPATLRLVAAFVEE